MGELLGGIITLQNITQGGGVLMALALVLMVFLLFKSKEKMETTKERMETASDETTHTRLVSLTEQSNRTIDRNTEAHLQTARALTQHDVILNQLIHLLERKL